MKALLLFLLVQPAFAEFFDGQKCQKELKELSKEWKATEEWSKHFQDGLENSFFASPTSTVGEWVVTKQIPEGAVISKVSQSGRIEVAIKGSDCKKEVKTYPHGSPSLGLTTDKDIADFVSKNKTGAIYVWSPRMVLSQKGIPEIKKAASKLKLPILVLLDKDISASEFSKLQKELGPIVTARVDSLEFKMRNVGQHFPALMVFKDSKILPEVKYGHEKSDRYQSDLVRMLGSGK